MRTTANGKIAPYRGVKFTLMNTEFYWKYINKKLFHVTSHLGYKGIKSKAAILPNSGERDFSFEQSKRSFAKNNGYVALFDFEEPSYEKIELMKSTWLNIMAKHQPAIVIVLNREKLNEKIILNASLGAGYAQVKFMEINYYVPQVETWYPEPIDVSNIENVYEIDWENEEVKTLASET